MKTTLRILRILFKLLLLAYVTVINIILISAFYVLLLAIVGWVAPSFLPGLFAQYSFAHHLVYSMPFYIVLLYILYSLSPLNVWVMRMKEGYKPLDSNERARLERLLLEMGMERKLNIYRNRDARTNAVTFGFNTIGLTGGILGAASDEELKGIICHEVGHISHYDFVYQVLLFSMQSLGYRCLYGLFLIPALVFGVIGNFMIAVVPAIRFAVVGIAKLWWGAYKLLHHTIYGISRIADVNINKYAEYRCDTYAVRYGCGEGLLSFLRRLAVAETGGERTSFTEYIMSTHPSTEKRIARLEKLLNNRKRMPAISFPGYW